MESHYFIPVMNRFNKTETAISPMQTMLAYDFPFLRCIADSYLSSTEISTEYQVHALLIASI